MNISNMFWFMFDSFSTKPLWKMEFIVSGAVIIFCRSLFSFMLDVLRERRKKS